VYRLSIHFISGDITVALSPVIRYLVFSCLFKFHGFETDKDCVLRLYFSLFPFQRFMNYLWIFSGI